MFSNSDNKVREKKFPIPKKLDSKEKGSVHHGDTDTMTDNHLLFLAQRERVRSSTQEPVSRWRRLFRWR